MSRTQANPLLYCLVAGALSACSSVSFKQGASGDEFRQAERACQSTTSERSAFIQCMAAKGWWSRSVEELSQIGFVAVDNGDEAGTEPDTPAVSDVPTASAAAGAASTSVAPGGDAAGKTPGPAPVVQAKTAAAPRDPMSRMRIAMWAKAGADGSALTQAQNTCLTTLGAGHEPDPVAGTVTRGLYDCLRKQGWTGMTLR
jgi:hypothetical protein